MEGGAAMKVTFESHVIEIEHALDEQARRALQIVGMQVENYARNYAPVDTGRLRNSITSELGPATDKPYVQIGSNVDYAVYQELSTSKMPACNGGKGFLRPAINDHMEEYKNIIKEELSDG